MWIIRVRRVRKEDSSSALHVSVSRCTLLSKSIVRFRSAQGALHLTVYRENLENVERLILMHRPAELAFLTSRCGGSLRKSSAVPEDMDLYSRLCTNIGMRISVSMKGVLRS